MVFLFDIYKIINFYFTDIKSVNKLKLRILKTYILIFLQYNVIIYIIASILLQQ